MMLFVLLLVFLCTLKGSSACEGECITGIVNVFVGNYSSIVHNALSDAASEISDQLIPPSSRPSNPTTLIAPVTNAYTSSIAHTLTSVVFTTHFHGKCQRPVLSSTGGVLLTQGPLLPGGTPAGEASSYPASTYHNISRFTNGTAKMEDPAGCPDPDCPVVCGTPGSIAHFYRDLVTLAFDGVESVLRSAARGSAARKVANNVVKLAKGAKGKNMEDDVLRILAEVPGKVYVRCGGRDLGNCSWEREMKEYILRYD